MSGKPGSRSAHGGRVDDWLAEQGELNWLDDLRRNEADTAEHPAAAATSERGHRGRAPARSRPDVSAAGSETVVRRRRILGLAAFGALVVTAIAVAIATSGGENPRADLAVRTTPPTASTPQPTTTPGTSGAPTTSQPTTQAQPGSSPSALRVTLPAGGTLSIGDSGPAVVQLQKVLAALHLKVGKPDGTFGSATQAAVAAFQTAHHLNPDGIVGTTTARSLNQALASPRARG